MKSCGLALNLDHRRVGCLLAAGLAATQFLDTLIIAVECLTADLASN
jgi:hypothetical protein